MQQVDCPPTEWPESPRIASLSMPRAAGAARLARPDAVGLARPGEDDVRDQRDDILPDQRDGISVDWTGLWISVVPLPLPHPPHACRLWESQTSPLHPARGRIMLWNAHARAHLIGLKSVLKSAQEMANPAQSTYVPPQRGAETHFVRCASERHCFFVFVLKKHCLAVLPSPPAGRCHLFVVQLIWVVARPLAHSLMQGHQRDGQRYTVHSAAVSLV